MVRDGWKTERGAPVNKVWARCGQAVDELWIKGKGGAGEGGWGLVGSEAGTDGPESICRNNFGHPDRFFLTEGGASA
jgi:hypothetical protein